MNEIRKPNLKGEDLTEKFKSLHQYLHELVDEVNWNLLSLQNKQVWEGEKIKKLTSEAEKTTSVSTEIGTFRGRFNQVGRTVHVIISFIPGGSGTGTGTVELTIPSDMSPSFYDSEIPAAQTQQFRCFLKKNKLAIDYEFAENEGIIGLYFQYVS